MTNTATTVSVETLAVIAHKNQSVITTELLAQLYDTDVIRIQQNYTRNADRFVEGKHFFKLEGEALREFKKSLTSSKIVSANAKHFTLWTERGAARHAKMLDTDQAWEVFEKLEDCYFVRKESALTQTAKAKGITSAVHGKLTAAHQNLIADAVERRALQYPEADRARVNILLWSAIKAKYQPIKPDCAPKKLAAYKFIDDAYFDDILQLIARVDLGDTERVVISLPEVRKALAAPTVDCTAQLQQLAHTISDLDFVITHPADFRQCSDNLRLLGIGMEKLEAASGNDLSAVITALKQIRQYLIGLWDSASEALFALAYFDMAGLNDQQKQRFNQAKALLKQSKNLAV